MKLIKINPDHYIIVDGDSEIKVGDWFLPISGIGWELNKPKQADSGGGYNNNHCKKITHSTQPLNKSLFFTDRVWGCERLSLGEVKELIGEKSWKGYIDGTEWEIEIIDGQLKLK